MTEVTIEKVNKIYERGNVHAVQNLNLQIKDGEFVALLGPLRLWQNFNTKNDCWLGGD